MAIMRTTNNYSKDYNEYGQKATFVGITENPSGSNAAIPVVYGCRKIEGVRFWNQVDPNNQSVLYCAYALSEGWCLGISQIFIDDISLNLSSTDLQHRVPKLITQGKYAGVLEVEFIDGRGSATGSTNIGASTILTRDLTSNPSSTWSEVSYLVCKFYYSTVYTKLPKVSCNLFGRKIPEWLTGSTISVYSDNPVYVIWDLLSNSVYGKNIQRSEIDQDSFTAAANACAVKRQGQLATSQNIFRCNWICDTKTPVLDNVKTILETFQINLSFVQGKWFLSIESSPQTSAYGTFPYVTFNDDNVIGEVSIQYPSISEKFNSVSVEYIEPTQNFQTSSVTYSYGSEEEDNGLKLDKKITSNLITSKVVAYDIAKMTLLRSRNQIFYTFKSNREAHQCRIGDYAYLATTIPFTNNQKVIITNMIMNQDYTFDIECVSYDPTWYPASFTENVTLPVGSSPGDITIPVSTWALSSDKDSVGYVIEGQTITYTVTTENIANGTAFTWSITNVGTGYISGGDIVGSYNGSGTITSNTATFTKTATTDGVAETDEIIYVTIRDSQGLSVARNQLKVKDPTITAPTVVLKYTFATCPTLDDNLNWYLGYTDSSGTVYDANRMSGYGTGGSVKLPYVAQVVKSSTTTVLLDFQVGLIDRDINGYNVVKDIRVTWTNGSSPFGYRYQIPSPTGYGIEQWQYDYVTPPLSLQPTQAKLIGGGTRWSPTTTITALENTMRMKAISGKGGQYELNASIKLPIIWSGNGSISTSVNYYFGPDFTKANSTTGNTIILKFYDYTNKKFLGTKVIQMYLNSPSMFNNTTYAASSSAWLSTMGSIPY